MPDVIPLNAAGKKKIVTGLRTSLAARNMGALLIVLFRSALPHHSSRMGNSMVTLEKKQGTTAASGRRRDAVLRDRKCYSRRPLDF
jgi:hypothetical protein